MTEHVDQITPHSASHDAESRYHTPLLGVFGAYWRLIRGGNVIIAAAGTLVGALLTGAAISDPRALIAAAVTALVAAGANALNDWADRDVDRINRPDRPLVTGTIQPTVALVLTFAALAAAIVLAIRLGTLPAIVCAVAIALLILYDLRFSRSFLVGNLVVALCGALPLVFGALSVGTYLGSLTAPVLAAALAYMLHFARELLKDVADLPGDRAVDAKTVATSLGAPAAMRFAAMLLMLTNVLVVPPAWWNWFGPVYNWAVALVIVPALLAGAVTCWIRPNENTARQWSAALKAVMVVGVLAIWGGRI